MIERLPVVEPLQRALYLRSLDLFRDLPAHDLALLAQLMREEWLRHGTVLYGPGTLVGAMHLIVEGRVRCTRGERWSNVVDGPGVVGLLEILADSPSTSRAVAESNVLALAIDASAFLDVLEDRFPLLEQLRAGLARQLLGLRHLEEAPAPAQATGDQEPAVPATDFVQRLLWLRGAPELRDMGISVLAALLREPREIHLAAGEELWRRDDDPAFFALVTEGEIGCSGESSRPIGRFGPGSVLGLEDVFAALPRALTAAAETPAVALAIDTATLLDAAEDHIHVATRILAHCSRRLLRLQQRQSAAEPSAPARQEENA